jgi:hypothetical protein
MVEMDGRSPEKLFPIVIQRVDREIKSANVFFLNDRTIYIATAGSIDSVVVVVVVRSVAD